VSESNQRILALLQAWQAEPLTEDEQRLLNEFGEFQAQHPLRFTSCKQLAALEAFGTFDFDETYDYKAERSKR
jgi:hypothetical protein